MNPGRRPDFILHPVRCWWPPFCAREAKENCFIRIGPAAPRKRRPEHPRGCIYIYTSGPAMTYIVASFGCVAATKEQSPGASLHKLALVKFPGILKSERLSHWKKAAEKYQWEKIPENMQVKWKEVPDWWKAGCLHKWCPPLGCFKLRWVLFLSGHAIFVGPSPLLGASRVCRKSVKRIDVYIHPRQGTRGASS